MVVSNIMIIKVVNNNKKEEGDCGEDERQRTLEK